jgi:serine protease
MSRADLLDAIAWASGLPVPGIPENPTPARVINMSIAGGLSVCGSDLQKLINRVIEKKYLSLQQRATTFTNPYPNPPTAMAFFQSARLMQKIT